jgi:hypothetical protein
MKFKVLLAGSLAIALSAPAFATDDGKEKSEVKQKKICRTETVTGSRLAKRRICLTQGQWDDIAENARKDLNDYSRRQGVGRETGSGMGANNNAGI